jgi:hypothetical protein
MDLTLDKLAEIPPREAANTTLPSDDCENAPPAGRGEHWLERGWPPPLARRGPLWRLSLPCLVVQRTFCQE